MMDLKMKGVDGIMATSQILTDFTDAQVLAVSSSDNPELRRAAREAVARTYVAREDLHYLPGILAGHSLEISL